MQSEWIKKLGLIFNKVFQGGEVVTKCALTQAGTTIGCIWLSAHELLFYFNKIIGFQGFKVTGQISVGDLKVLLQGIKIGPFIHKKNRHHAQPDPALKEFIYATNGIFHYRILSYL